MLVLSPPTPPLLPYLQEAGYIDNYLFSPPQHQLWTSEAKGPELDGSDHQ